MASSGGGRGVLATDSALRSPGISSWETWPSARGRTTMRLTTAQPMAQAFVTVPLELSCIIIHKQKSQSPGNLDTVTRFPFFLKQQQHYLGFAPTCIWRYESSCIGVVINTSARLLYWYYANGEQVEVVWEINVEPAETISSDGQQVSGGEDWLHGRVKGLQRTGLSSVVQNIDCILNIRIQLLLRSKMTNQLSFNLSSISAASLSTNHL